MGVMCIVEEERRRLSKGEETGKGRKGRWWLTREREGGEGEALLIGPERRRGLVGIHLARFGWAWDVSRLSEGWEGPGFSGPWIAMFWMMTRPTGPARSFLDGRSV